MKTKINYLRCTICKGQLDHNDDYFFCSFCDVSYKLQDGIPDLLPPIIEDDIKITIKSWEDINFDYSNYVNNLPTERLDAIDKPLLEQCKSDATILEVGCGSARLKEKVERVGSTYFGIDPSLKMLKQASDKTNLIRGVGEYLPFPENSFDTLISGYHSFRYINLEKCLKECFRVLKPGGNLAFTLWNYWGLKMYSIADNIINLRIPRVFNHAPKVGICNDVMWIGKEVNRLQNTGFIIESILATKNSPLSKISKNKFGWQGYYHGKWALLGYDLIFICKNNKNK